MLSNNILKHALLANTSIQYTVAKDTEYAPIGL